MACKYSNDIVCDKGHSKCSECSCQRAIDGYLKKNERHGDCNKSENYYNHKIDELRLNRCIMSMYKYGDSKKNFTHGYVDTMKTMQMCIKAYEDDKNREHLLDAMNYLMFEFTFPQMKDTFFKATDSDGSAGIHGMSEKEVREYGRV